MTEAIIHLDLGPNSGFQQAQNGIPKANGPRPDDPMPPPPEKSYPTLEELKDAVRKWTRQYGYDLVIDSAQKKKKVVRCGRAGKPQNTRKLNDTTRTRKTTSNKCGCPMVLSYVQHDFGWSIVHSRNRLSYEHNHDRTPPGTASTNHRRHERNQEIGPILQHYVEIGLTTKQILTALKVQFPNMAQTPKDISNIRDRVRKKIKIEQTEASTSSLQVQ